TPRSNPIEVFSAWMADAKAHSGIREPLAMALATLGEGGVIHNRIVLCKSWSADGFTFFTNYNSAKGSELARHPRAGAVFYWDPLARQVRVSGPVRKVPEAESQAYWRTRSRDSQLSQYISKQSEEVESREE